MVGPVFTSHFPNVSIICRGTVLISGFLMGSFFFFLCLIGIKATKQLGKVKPRTSTLLLK